MTLAICCALPKQSFAAGVPPLGASTSREPTRLPEGSKGEVSTSTAADAAELDALYGDLPSYQPEPARGTEIEGTVVTEATSLPTISMSEVPSVSPAPSLAGCGAEGDYKSYFPNTGG